MSASSGLTGFCKNSECKHANNEHNKFTCKEQGCRKQWKICQTGSHTTTKYAICAKCTAHPGGGPDGFENWEDLT
jgi:hypothetical protein